MIIIVMSYDESLSKIMHSRQCKAKIDYFNSYCYKFKSLYAEK